MQYIKIAIVCSVLAVGAAFAHSGVKDPHVNARMQGMMTLGKATKVLADMSRGKTPFDQTKAQAALTSMSEEAAQIKTLFEPKADDPKSEAKPEIWTSWSQFEQQADSFESIVTKANIGSLEALKTSVRAIGSSCSACHKAYRE